MLTVSGKAKVLTLAAALLAGSAFMAQPAQAARVAVGIGVGAYVPPPVTYYNYAPPVVYSAPAATYYAPAPTYYTPAPGYCYPQPAVVYPPAPVYYSAPSYDYYAPLTFNLGIGWGGYWGGHWGGGWGHGYGGGHWHR